MDDTVRDYDYIEELNGHDDHDGDHDGGSTNSSGPVSTDIDLSSRLAAVSSKPQRRQRPGNHSIPQKSKSAGLPTSRVTTAATTTATSTGLVTPGRLPRRNKSGDLPPSRATHNAHTTHRELSSKSAHAVSEDWFDFDSGPIPKHSTTSISTQSHSSNDDNSGELEESSFHGEENNRRSVRLRERREIVRTMSGKRERERVHEGGEALPGTALATTTSTSTSAATPAPPPPPPRGLARTKSGVPRPPQNQTPPSRVPPTRSRSDALMSSRRESMKALYRSNQDELTSTSRSISSTSKIVSEGESNSGTPRPRPRPQRAASGLEAGALSAVMMDRRPPTRSRSSDSTQLLTPIDDTNENSDQEQSKPQDAKWLERRQNKQDEIMTLAHDVKERFADAREKQEDLDYAASREIGTASSGDNFGNFNDDDDDDDQPMAMRTKKTVLEQLKKVANKTGAGARSLGKGTVNAIHDPKLAAKRLGHLSKDVGKATIKTALDPSKLAKGAKNMTVGSAKMGADLTKGVAKTTFGATKTVVKGGVSATTKSAKLTMKGTKKVVKGTVRAVKGHHKHKHETEEEYNARNLTDRNQSTFYDRIASMVESTTTNDEDDNVEDAILAGIAAAEGGGDAHQSKSGVNKSKRSSILMPTNLVGASSHGNWDV